MAAIAPWFFSPQRSTSYHKQRTAFQFLIKLILLYLKGNSSPKSYHKVKTKPNPTCILSTSIWMRFLFKRDCGDHVPFCFIATWTVCSSGTFFFRSLSPLNNRTGILRRVGEKKSYYQKEKKRHENWASFSDLTRLSIFIFTN